jgi:tetratricopeptide (TPR) repeat protein
VCALTGRSKAPHERALALSGTGFTFIADGDQDQARSAFEQSLPLFHEAGDPLGGALAAAALGHVLAAQHDDERTDEVLEQARNLKLEAGTGERSGQERVQYLLVAALVDNFLGQIQLSKADYDRAAQLFTAGLDAARSTPDQFTILISLYDLALATQARGDLDGVAGLLRQGLSLAAEARHLQARIHGQGHLLILLITVLMVECYLAWCRCRRAALRLRPTPRSRLV